LLLLVSCFMIYNDFPLRCTHLLGLSSSVLNSCMLFLQILLFKLSCGVHQRHHVRFVMYVDVNLAGKFNTERRVSEVPKLDQVCRRSTSGDFRRSRCNTHCQICLCNSEKNSKLHKGYVSILKQESLVFVLYSNLG
jgi:hypothetical protein